MAQALTVHNGVVKFPAGKTFQTQYGDRVNAVLTIPATGEEVKLWGNPGDPALTALKKGQQVAIAQDQKGWKLLNTPLAEDTPANTANGNGKAAIAHTPLDPDQKRAIASYIDELASVYNYCTKVAATKCVDPNAPYEENVRAIATTLFIQTVKKFNL
jgi:hypothetical protein